MRCDVRDAFAKFSQKASMIPAILNTGPPRIGLAFRTRPTAPTQAYTQIGAATKSQNDPIRAERPRERAWRGATSRMAPRNGDSRASEISRAEHGALQSSDPFLARTRVSKTIEE